MDEIHSQYWFDKWCVEKKLLWKGAQYPEMQSKHWLDFCNILHDGEKQKVKRLFGN